MKAFSRGAHMLWLLACLGGLATAIWYSLRPGLAPTHTRAPASSRLLVGEAPNFLLFMHPKCSCSHATLAELARVLPALREEGARVTVVFNNPAGEPGWVKGDLWDKASRLEGVRVYEDHLGQETGLYGAETSGHAVLVDAAGAVVFSGGLTPSRGHEGPSEGTAFLRRWRESRQEGSFFTRVFGCGLFGRKA